MGFKKEFVHLHLHTQFSLLDGAIKIKELPEYAQNLGYKAVAITDHGNLFGSYQFYTTLKEWGLKPIIGIEAYITKGSRKNKSGKVREDNYTDTKNNHIILIAKDDTGFKNLRTLTTIGYTEGLHQKPRIDLEVLNRYSEGLICLTACLKGLPTYYASKGEEKEAEKWLLKLVDIFGKEDLYVELQPHDLEEQKIANRVLIDLAKKHGLKLIATWDVHYLKPEDKVAHNILTALQMKTTYRELLQSPYGQKLQRMELHFASPEEVWKRFENTFDGWEKALLNTLEVAEKVSDRLEYFENKEYKMPVYEVPKGETLESYFKKLAIEGLKKRIAKGQARDDNLYWERLEYEMDVISKMGFPGYFLIVQDFINWARNKGIPVGPGRGCVLPETQVMLGSGALKPIKDISVGDFVLTHRGAVLPVLQKFEYDVEETLVRVEVGNEVLTLTEDHKVLALQDGENRLVWISAGKLKKDDFLVFPRQRSTNKEIVYDLLRFIEKGKTLRWDERFIYDERETTGFQPVKIPRFVKFDEFLAKILGCFISEKYTDIDEKGGVIIFNFPTKGEEYAQELLGLFEKVFNLKGKIDRLNNTLKVEFKSKIVAQFLRKLCGDKAINKQIPSEIVLNGKDKYVKTLIACIFRKGGRSSKTGNIKYITPSKSLAYQLRLLLARFGFWASITVEKKQRESWNPQYSLNISGKQLLLWNEAFKGFPIKLTHRGSFRNDTFFVDKKHIYLKIKKVEKVPYKGKVYDITVPFDHSYTTSAVSIHNSAGGSLVAYALGITDIDPIKHDLLFERFLNPDRVSMPDIDVDFCQERREEVINYVRQKYGKDNVSQIITYNVLKSKSVIRDVCRALGVPLEKADKLAKLIPQGETQGSQLSLEEMSDWTLGELKEKYGERPDIEDAVIKFREIINSDPSLKKAVEIGKKLEGLTRHTGFHAAGVVIAPKPLKELVPLFARNDKDKETKKENLAVATQYDMGALEGLGLLKMDLLGLKTLTELDLMKKMVKRLYGKEIDLLNLDYEDPKVYELLKSGKTTGVFQLESRGMQNLLLRLKPDRFDDLIAVLALYRPGPLKSGVIDSFIRRKHGEEKITYEFPELEPILRETYGIWAYQEQIMRMAQILAGFTPGEADTLRKAIGKKKKDLMKQMRDKFIEGAAKRGYDRKKIEELWNSIEKFASYSFNKSHSTAYAYVSFQTAYFKTYYPGVFFAVKLSTEKNENKFIALIKDAKLFGFEFLPPDINKSDIHFTLEEKEGKIYLRYGLSKIKGVGEEAAKAIKEAKKKYGKFKSLVDFIKKVDKRKVNKKVIEALIEAGAFDFTGESREVLLKKVRSQEKLSLSVGQNILFISESNKEKETPKVENFLELLRRERQLLGFYISGHPLDKYPHLLKRFKTRIEDIEEEESLYEVSIPGVIVDLEEKRTRSGKYMALFNLIDKTGLVECVIFPQTYEVLKDKVQEDAVVVVEGTLVTDFETDKRKLMVKKILIPEDVEKRLKIVLRFPEKVINGQFLEKLKKFLRRLSDPYEGIPTYITVYSSDGRVFEIELGREYWVLPNANNLNILKTKLGKYADIY
ncbi:MAG TPA: DNA polymerase III subunit alpha [Aquifex aeolicus]|nr:DNA polymerase III subunit alpha [Aquificales bacterium]HIQ26639.1 DNA polymerase III subunit alpha [Aquifex aeolicus]